MKELKEKILDLIRDSDYSLEDILAEVSREEEPIEKILAYSVAYEYAQREMKDPQIKYLRDRYNILLDNLKQTYMPVYQSEYKSIINE